MSLRPLYAFFSVAVCLLIVACGDKSESTIVTDEIVEDNHWTDSIFGTLTAKQQYNQHLIIEVPANYQIKADSLVAWVAEEQPGALKFINWNFDSIEYVKEALDTCDIIQPIIYGQYYDLLNIPVYDYWKSNKLNSDLNYTRVFEKAGMNLLDLEYDPLLDDETRYWLDTLNREQALMAIPLHFNDKEVNEDFDRFMSSIQRYDYNVFLKIGQYDSIDFSKLRKSVGYEGMFVVDTKIGALNSFLRTGLDFAFKNIESGDSYSNWSGPTPDFEESTRRILDLKARRKSNRTKMHLEAELLYTSLNLLTNSVALLSNKSKMLPFSGKFTLYTPEEMKVNGTIRKEVGFSNHLTQYDEKSLKNICESKGNKVIVLNDSVSNESLKYLASLSKESNTLVCFSKLSQYDQISSSPNLLFVPIFSSFNASLLVQQLSSRLSVNGSFIYEDTVVTGMNLNKTLLARTQAEFTGLDSDTLNRINWVVSNAINGRAFPGCQVLLAKNGCIIYDRQFGHHSYTREKVVTDESIYDLASLTKVVATTMVGMKLWEMGKYDLNDSLYKYLPDSLRFHLRYPSTIRNITFHELFIHKSGLPAGFPLIRYLDYTKNEGVGRFDRYYCDAADSNYCIEVAENFYMEREYGDSMWLKLNQMWLDPSKPYKYSDVNMNTLYYMFKSIIQKNPRDFGFTEPEKKLADKDLFVEFLYKTIYKPLKMGRTRYKPLDHFSKNSIVPTEDESFWRKQLLQGSVHDPNAALMGGVGGNAGMFSTAHDLAILCQMLLNKGTYGGQRILKQTTVEKFTSTAEDSHRGLGFNKRTITTSGFGMADSCSIATYGHTGFTGTCFWIDPEEELVYIFLSNRVHPKVNNRIYQYGIRKNIHNTAYAARLNY